MEKVVVLMSTYNGARYLTEQIDSIINQRAVEVKILIRDDGSDDDTINILEHYRKENPGTIDIIYGLNKGYARSFTILVKEALVRYPDIKWFAFADQDDVWLNEKLSQGLSKIISDEKVSDPWSQVIVYASNTMLVDAQLNPIKLRWKPRQVNITPNRALIQNFATGCTMIFSRAAAALYSLKAYENLLLHDTFLYQLAVFLGIFIWDPQSYILYRQHNNNQIGSKSFIGRFKNRLTVRAFSKRVIEKRNKNFLEAVGSSLSAQQIKLIKKFCNYRESPISRIKLLFNYSISYNNFEQDFFYRLKIILGTV